MDEEEFATVPVWEKEQVIHIKGLHDTDFTIVKLLDNKYILYIGLKEIQRNFIGIFNSFDDVFDAMDRKAHKEHEKMKKLRKLTNY